MLISILKGQYEDHFLKQQSFKGKWKDLFVFVERNDKMVWQYVPPRWLFPSQVEFGFTYDIVGDIPFLSYLTPHQIVSLYVLYTLIGLVMEAMVQLFKTKQKQKQMSSNFACPCDQETSMAKALWKHRGITFSKSIASIIQLAWIGGTSSMFIDVIISYLNYRLIILCPNSYILAKNIANHLLISNGQAFGLSIGMECYVRTKR